VLTKFWQGRVAVVLDELRVVLGTLTLPTEDQQAKSTDPGALE
jgi:hypothetical protein